VPKIFLTVVGATLKILTPAQKPSPFIRHWRQSMSFQLTPHRYALFKTAEQVQGAY
jgi:hypothetical protein